MTGCDRLRGGLSSGASDGTCGFVVNAIRSESFVAGIRPFLFALLLAAGPPSRAALAANAPDAVPAGSSGRELYLRYCALCHGKSAEGYAADHASALGNPDFLAVANESFLRAAITDGRPGTPMSAWGRKAGGPLDSDQVDAIVTYLRSLASAPPVNVWGVRVQGDAERGRPVYVERCESCHGEKGEGSPTAMSLSHPNFQRTASDGYLRYTIEHGRRGTPMKAFGDLPPQTLDDLVAFVRTLEHAPSLPQGGEGGPPPMLNDLVMNPGGRAPSFDLREGRYVPAEAVKAALDANQRLIVLDTRATSDWALGHIPGAAPFPFYNLEQMVQNLPRDGTWIVAYCSCPHAASDHVVDNLRKIGFDHTAVLDEGFPFWMKQGYPVVRGSLAASSAGGQH